MSEVKTGTYSIGLNRAKYLDLANLNFIKDNYDGVKESINAFLDTIEEDSPAGKYITDKFDEIYNVRMKQRAELEHTISDAGFLEQSMTGNQGFFHIDIEALHSMKSICWSASHKFGLLYE